MGSGIGKLKLVINSTTNIWAQECIPRIEMYRQFSLYQPTHGLAELQRRQHPYESIKIQQYASHYHDCKNINDFHRIKNKNGEINRRTSDSFNKTLLWWKYFEGDRKKIQGLPPSPYLQPGVLR